MNKLTKVGLSALCGSLATIAVTHAGEMSVSGGATATMYSEDGGVTGNPFGMASNLTFKGTGELDGGQVVTMTVTQADKSTFSGASIDLATNMLGTWNINLAGGGTGIGGHDDKSPTAWEEVWGTGITTGIDLEKGVSSSTNIGWSSPKFAWGSQVKFAWAPENDLVTNNDKSASGAATNQRQEGFDLLLDIAADSPINLFVGGSITKQVKEVALEEDRDSDWREAVAGVKISIGPIALGGQLSGTQTGALHRAGEIEYIGNSSIGVALNVNDNLSISYGEARSIKSEAVSGSNKDSQNMDIPKGRMKGESYQIAYTLGGMGLKFANSKWDNTAYTIRGKKAAVEAQTVALTLAF